MNQFKRKVIKNFDAGAHQYDQYADIQKLIAIELCQKIETAPKKILEIGCGTGFLTNQLIDKYPKSKIIATDISPNMIAKCQQKFKESDVLKFQVMDGENIKLDGKFDLIVSSMTFQWFENLPKATRDLKKILNPNGMLYFDLPSRESFPEWRDILERNNFNSGLIKAPVEIGVFETKTYKKQYDTGLSFLGKMKKIGAHYSGEDYQNLNPAQMRKMCQQFDEGERFISWVINYCKINA